MKSLSFIQTLRNESPLFKGASSLTDVLCLATFKASGQHKEIETVEDALRMWAGLSNGCSDCVFFKNCLACEISE